MTNSITVKDYIKKPLVQDTIKERLQGKAQQFTVSLLSTIGSNSALAQCEPQSVLTAAMTAASLDLPINQNLGFAYIIPYKGQAQFQMGYKGFIQLAQRSGQFKTINVSEVKDGEIKNIDRLTGDIEFSWIEEGRDKLQTIGYVGYMELTNGFHKTLYMTIEELKSHGLRFSQTMKKGYGLWTSDFDAMASKTVIKLLLAKYAPLTVEMQKAQLADQAVIKGEDEYEYIDNTPELPSDIAKEKEYQKISKHIKESQTESELSMCEEFCTTDELKKEYAEKLQTFTKKS